MRGVFTEYNQSKLIKGSEEAILEHRKPKGAMWHNLKSADNVSVDM
jgi:hypothetical protein